jgi:general stress protein 26
MNERFDSHENVKLAKLIHGMHVAMLTTSAENGELRSRPMGSQGIDDDGRLTFFTSRQSSLVEEATQRPVSVTYADAGKNTYISISGWAELDTDREAVRAHWKPEFKAWFPEGENDPNTALLRVTIDSAEYWDAPAGPLIKLAEFAKAAAGGKTVIPLGDHAKV